MNGLNSLTQMANRSDGLDKLAEMSAHQTTYMDGLLRMSNLESGLDKLAATAVSKSTSMDKLSALARAPKVAFTLRGLNINWKNLIESMPNAAKMSATKWKALMANPVAFKAAKSKAMKALLGSDNHQEAFKRFARHSGGDHTTAARKFNEMHESMIRSRLGKTFDPEIYKAPVAKFNAGGRTGRAFYNGGDYWTYNSAGKAKKVNVGKAVDSVNPNIDGGDNSLEAWNEFLGAGAPEIPAGGGMAGLMNAARANPGMAIGGGVAAGVVGSNMLGGRRGY